MASKIEGTTAGAERALLVVDGGTTNLRVTLLDAATLRPLARRQAAGGVRHTAIDGHNGRLKEALSSCIQGALSDAGLAPEAVSRCIAYGMITSDMGLLTVPHAIAPAGAEDLGAGMRSAVFPEIAPFPFEFIPGVRNFAGGVNAETCPSMDMMRGEETESVGLYRLLRLSGEALFVLPGSHNKFVQMDAAGRVAGCATSISGELLDAMTRHTILAGAVDGGFCSPETYRADMAAAGAREGEKSGLGRAAFAGRILRTLGDADAAAVQSWLLGAALQEDVKAMRAFMGDTPARVFVAGKAPMQQAFIDVLAALGMPGASPVPPELGEGMGLTGALVIAGIARVR